MRFAVNGGGAADGFESVELGGIVAAGDHHGAVGFEMELRIVEDGRGDDAEIGDMAAGGLEAAHQSIAQPGRTQARVAAKIDLGSGVALEVCSERLTEEFDARIGEFEIGMSGVGDAADIVFAKDGWLQHEIIWNHDSVVGIGAKMITEATNESRRTPVYNH